MDRKKELFCQEIRQNGVPVKPGLPYFWNFCRSRKSPLPWPLLRIRRSPESICLRQGWPLFLISWYLATRSGGESRTQRFFSRRTDLGVSPERSVVLEDSLNGVLAGIQGGFRTIMVPDMTQPPPKLEQQLFCKCENLFQIIGCLRELL